jgi:PII-like signaling protein
LLHRHGFAGASVLMGVDGTVQGVRRRARFFARNAQVPLLITGVGESERVAGVLGELAAMLAEPLMTLERVQILKRDGVLLTGPAEIPSSDDSGLGYWQKVVIHGGEQAHHAGQPIYHSLIRRLRREGAAGATALRAQWGYHGAHRPHGERFFSLRRHVPVLTVMLDTPANMRKWLAIAYEMTGETGLVTSELVPAMRAGGPGVEHSGLALAERRSS